MSDLFSIPLPLSPRLNWMAEHRITVSETHYETNRFRAYQNQQQIGKGDTAEDACFAAATSLNLKLWNES